LPPLPLPEIIELAIVVLPAKPITAAPLSVALFPTKVQLVTVSVPAFKMAPPKRVDEFPTNVLLLIFAVPASI
jgi:hypothetical protein